MRWTCAFDNGASTELNRISNASFLEFTVPHPPGNLPDNLISVRKTRIRWLLMMKPELLRNTKSNETPNRDVLYRGGRARGHAAHLGHGDSCGVGLLCAQSLIRPMRNVPIHTEPNVHSGTHSYEGLDSR
jgi:hypothetical protein